MEPRLVLACFLHGLQCCPGQGPRALMGKPLTKQSAHPLLTPIPEAPLSSLKRGWSPPDHEPNAAQHVLCLLWTKWFCIFNWFIEIESILWHVKITWHSNFSVCKVLLEHGHSLLCNDIFVFWCFCATVVQLNSCDKPFGLWASTFTLWPFTVCWALI